MRKSYDPVKLEDNGKLMAISLGADYCAEHEWGIAGIKRSLGVPESVTRKIYGAKARTITKNDKINFVKTSKTIEGRSYDLYILTDWGYSFKSKDENINSIKELARKNWSPNEGRSRYKQEGVEPLSDIHCGWSEGNFIIVSTDENMMTSLNDAFKKLDVAVMLSGGGVFQNAGLTFWILSNTPNDIKSHWDCVDEDHFELEDAVEKSGIKKILEDAGKGYYALSPRWNDDNKKELKFWLNPHDQNKYQYGWYNIDELKQWAKDKGPIVEKIKA